MMFFDYQEVTFIYLRGYLNLVSMQVDALALINCTSSQAGWIEWAYQKMNSRSLRSRGMTQGVLDYLMWHHFGRVSCIR